MQKYADYVEEIETDSLRSGRKYIRWAPDRRMSTLSGINGVGKSTTLNKMVRSLSQSSEFPSRSLKGVRLKVNPNDARWMRYGITRSFDRLLINSDSISKVSVDLITGLDQRLLQLQHEYLGYQVNVGNRIIETLQSSEADAAEKAQQVSQPKKHFQDILDDLFTGTGKRVIRSENEIKFSSLGGGLTPYQLPDGEKQILVILLIVLVENSEHYIPFVDEPEVSLYMEWRKRLIDLTLELSPSVQTILATHSPAIIMNGWIDRVTGVTDITDK